MCQRWPEMGVFLSTAISDIFSEEISWEISPSLCFGGSVCQEIRKPPYSCMLRAHLGITPSGLLLGAEDVFVPGITDRNRHVCPHGGRIGTGSCKYQQCLLPRGNLIKKPQSWKPDNCIFILLVTTEENWKFSQNEAACFSFLNLFQVIGTV